MNSVLKDGRLIYELVHKMAHFHMDLSKESTDLLIQSKDKINFPIGAYKDNLLDLFKDSKSHRYFALLHACNGLKPLEVFMPFNMPLNFWMHSMNALRKLEDILNTKTIFKSIFAEI